jgi:hypothetical protein
MPITCKFVNEGQGAIFTASGELTGSDVARAYSDIIAAVATETIPYCFNLFDFNGVSGIKISSAELEDLAYHALRLSRLAPAGRVVAIHATSDFAFGLSRMWMVFIEQTGWEVELFRDRSKAIAWLRERVAARFGIIPENRAPILQRHRWEAVGPNPFGLLNCARAPSDPGGTRRQSCGRVGAEGRGPIVRSVASVRGCVLPLMRRASHRQQDDAVLQVPQQRTWD